MQCWEASSRFYPEASDHYQSQTSTAIARIVMKSDYHETEMQEEVNGKHRVASSRPSHAKTFSSNANRARKCQAPDLHSPSLYQDCVGFHPFVHRA